MMVQSFFVSSIRVLDEEIIIIIETKKSAEEL